MHAAPIKAAHLEVPPLRHRVDDLPRLCAELAARMGRKHGCRPKQLTPEAIAVLKTYAERNNYDPARWTFLTGALIDVDAITEQVGLVFRRQTPDALPDHNVRTILVDAEGKLRKIIVGNTWEPKEVVDDLIEHARAAASQASK